MRNPDEWACDAMPVRRREKMAGVYDASLAAGPGRQTSTSIAPAATPHWAVGTSAARFEEESEIDE